MMRKLIALLILKQSFNLFTTLTGLWVIVEFIIYLVKDTPFNWWSVFSVVICGVLLVTLTLMHGYMETKFIVSRNAGKKHKVKGAFDKRMEKVMEAQKRLKHKNE